MSPPPANSCGPIASDAPVSIEAVVDALAGSGAPVEVINRVADVEISAVTHDSRAVAPGTLFACLRGERVDGHDYAAAAVEAGAVALLVDHDLNESDVGTTPQIVVDDTRLRLGAAASLIAGHPSRAMTTVGITGTNGKTTTASMLAAIFEAAGRSTGIIGTLHGPRTTPEAPDLQRRLADFRDAGHLAAVLEVSSHALALHRVDGTEFDAVVFTNFGRDHLDLHGTPEEYFRAKARLFRREFAPLAVVNVDDTHGRLLTDVLADGGDGIRVVPYSTADLTDVRVSATSIAYTWQGHHIEVGIGGAFNVSNSVAALVTATELGIEVEAAVAGLRMLAPVPGRFETVLPSGGRADFAVVVDYAHTPDGIVEVIAAAKAVVEPGASVIIVFGCGGDRDQAKRPEMGAAAVAADRVIVTSDNPRSEDPNAIIDDILSGIDANYRDRVMSIPDRRHAIGEAIQVARTGDIVVIAGKGHERTQDLGGTVIDFDDRDVARSFLDADTEDPA
jgi:UDP-N-acetylmuramoyl-L-alanyl-D-glutamate--2,6-diaminopimelate ligase